MELTYLHDTFGKDKESKARSHAMLNQANTLIQIIDYCPVCGNEFKQFMDDPKAREAHHTYYIKSMELAIDFWVCEHCVGIPREDERWDSMDTIPIIYSNYQEIINKTLEAWNGEQGLHNVYKDRTEIIPLYKPVYLFAPHKFERNTK